uniref:TSA: Wollemia nobilis Ref_Wollemi_Transcript_14289_1408 transcribed RNA sequence n=1 Tax=Wollemia nobilis TaxID=56998 RepID=A0A0C9QPX5_9CONI
MAFLVCKIFCAFLLPLIIFPSQLLAEIPSDVLQNIERVNRRGPSYAIIVADKNQLSVVVSPENEAFKPDSEISRIDVSHSLRFHIGYMSDRRVIVVMSGRGLVNTARTTQVLLNLFNIGAVVHYGRASNANPDQLNIGDVAIPARIAHYGRFHWEKFGGDSGDYHRDIAKLTFSDHNLVKMRVPNRLESIYLQPEMVMTKPEVQEERFFIDVNQKLYRFAQKIEGLELAKCGPAIRSPKMCLQRQPMVRRVESGCSANIDVNNVAFRDFLRNNLNITTIDIESAGVALVCFNEKTPWLKMGSIFNFAGGAPPGGENDMAAIEGIWVSHLRVSLAELFRHLPETFPNPRLNIW